MMDDGFQKASPKILVVSPTPPPYSGPEIMTAQLLSSPLKDEYQLIHFNISKQREVSTKARFDLINIFYGLLQPFQLIWFILKYKPDLVYTNLAQNLGGFLRYASFILTAGLFGKLVVVRVMGDGFNHFYKRANPVLRWLIDLTLQRVNRFIVRATVLKKQFVDLVPLEKLKVVYSGIDVNEFNIPRERKDDEIRILFVGYLTKAKGALDLLQVVPIVAKKCPNVRFQFMGSKIDVERNITYVDNPDSNETSLQQLLTQENVIDHIELLGVQSGKRKIETFVNADIFVLPSYSEAFPTVVLEAMAAGLPVIATPVGALPEVFDEKSIVFVKPGNVYQLADAILHLIDVPNYRRQIAKHGQQIVRKQFDLSAYAGRLDALFSDTLKGDILKYEQ